jgi:hypothetical protein
MSSPLTVKRPCHAGRALGKLRLSHGLPEMQGRAPIDEFAVISTMPRPPFRGNFDQHGYAEF